MLTMTISFCLAFSLFCLLVIRYRKAPGSASSSTLPILSALILIEPTYNGCRQHVGSKLCRAPKGTLQLRLHHDKHDGTPSKSHAAGQSCEEADSLL